MSNIFTFGLGRERDYFVENLSMLVSGGMPIISALEAITEETRSRRMKKIIARIQSDVESGSPLWRALADIKLFPEHAISLIRLGEESGKFTENLKVVAVEEEKNRVFKSKLRSAMMYPIFTLSLTAIIGIGIAWFILPKLATVFSQLKIKLPLITKILIGAGAFLGEHGLYVVPAAAVFIIALSFFIFSFSKTKFIGQFILFSSPGISDLVREVEVARLGYLLGTLLDAGLPVTHALNSLASATEISRYKKLYSRLRDSVEDGNSFQKSFEAIKNIKGLIPLSIQRLIIAGEKSGALSEILLKIGQRFEARAETMTKNLTVILEPVLLVIVWLGVVAVALAVILPIYSLIGGFNVDAPAQTQSSPAGEGIEGITTAPPVQETPPVVKIKEDVSVTLRILPTGIGYLNARDIPSLDGEVVARVTPGEVIEYTNAENGWYKITVNCQALSVKCFRDGESGWVFGKYVEIIDN